ncbi:RNase adapter RapZ [Nocardia testacea]|uniref:RNase adapter RapZ n=1 Tax=Nocardia testacea TaxID=248551 RepID=UPI003C2B83C0
MTVLLVTGMSGTGKSAALILLEERGYRVVDTDYGGWTEHIPGSDGSHPEPQWHEPRTDGLSQITNAPASTCSSAER